MPKPTKGPRIGGTPAHERIILANLASQLFEHGKIVTTEAKAKRLRPYAEKLITKAKKGTVADRRAVLAMLDEHKAKAPEGWPGGTDHSRRIWTVLVFMVWHGIFVEDRIHPAIEEPVYPVRL